MVNILNLAGGRICIYMGLGELSSRNTTCKQNVQLLICPSLSLR